MYKQANPRLLNNLMSDCVDTLQAVYPHYAWGVKPYPDGSMISIVALIPGVHRNYGFELHTKNLQSVTERRKMLIKAGGELLERNRLDRHRETDARDVSGKRNTRGELIPE